MKRLLLAPLLLLFLQSCSNKYNSQIEAKEACDKWEANGIKFTIEIYYPYLKGTKTEETNNRWCRHEDSTRQYLGYELIGIKRGQHFKKNEYRNSNIKDVIKKYFRY